MVSGEAVTLDAMGCLHSEHVPASSTSVSLQPGESTQNRAASIKQHSLLHVPATGRVLMITQHRTAHPQAEVERCLHSGSVRPRHEEHEPASHAVTGGRLPGSAGRVDLTECRAAPTQAWLNCSSVTRCSRVSTSTARLQASTESVNPTCRRSAALLRRGRSCPARHPAHQTRELVAAGRTWAAGITG